jgi:DNA repair exonuclease SbcCD ATPase subunit
MLSSKKDLLVKCEKLGISCSKSLAKEKLVELINQKEKTKIITIENKKQTVVKYIYHLADIHIRYLDRHEEYKQIFEKLYNTINEDPHSSESILVMCGDIFHNRDRFVSETLVLFNDFIKNLSNLVEVFLIVGNHDCFNNSDRLDTVSGITSIKDYSNFHLLKDSGTYNFSNISFGVSSLLDCLELPFPSKEKGITSVALYHGIVSGCVLDNGTSSTEGIPLSSFNGYDITLLGDVHRRQFLSKDKTIAYPGSLIQQNFKEELDHGYLKWDVEEKQASFVKLDNDYCFIDIPVNDDIDISSIKFSKYSRLRLLINNITTEEQINGTIEKCKQFTTVIGVKKILKDVSINASGIKNNNSLLETVDQSELSIIKNIVDPLYIDEVLELHSNLLQNIDHEETFVKSLPWTISKIQFRNIFSYGQDKLNCIELKDGISGILANNASGKTNILNTIIYGLFGLSRTQNHLNKNIISRYAKKEGLLVRLTIDMLNGQTYVIERTATTKTRSRIKSSEEGQIDIVENLKFYKDDKNLNLGSKVETEKLIKDTLSILGKEEFVLTNMMSNSSYGANMSIISMSGTQLDEVFNNIFNLNKYKNLHKDSKLLAKKKLDELKTLKVKLEMTEKNLTKYEYENLNQTKEILQKKIGNGHSLLEQENLNLSVIEQKLLKLQKNQITKSETTLNSRLSEIEEHLSAYTGNIADLIKKEDSLEGEYDSLIQNYIKSDTLLPKPKVSVNESIENIKTSISINESNRHKIEFDSNITNEYLKAKKYISSISSDTTLDINNIKEVLEDLALDNSKKYYKLPKDSRDKIVSDLSKTYVDPNLILKYRKIIEDKENMEKMISENIAIDQEINTLKKMMRDKKIQNAHEIKEKLLKISDLLEYIDSYKESLDIKEDLRILKENEFVNTLVSEKSEILSRIEKLQSCLKDNEIDLSLCKRDIFTCQELRSVKDELLPKIKLLSHTLEIYKVYIDLTHQKNLPKFLISKVIKNITLEANELIYNTTGLLCEIQENEKWEIVVRKGKLTLGPEHCSGYERFILNTALKISFDKYKQLSSVNLFMIDETIDCVSESNFEQIDVLLEYLSKHYTKVILISHNEDLKKKVNNRIEILLENGSSSVCN